VKRLPLLAALLALPVPQLAGAQGSMTEDVLRRESRGNDGVKSDWQRQQDERDWKEAEVEPPAYPKDGLVEFRISGSGSFRFYVDPATLAVGSDGVVRYTMVARSGSGVENVSYEGIRCASGTYKVFARGQDGRWLPARSEWGETTQRWQFVLRTQYFCPMRLAVRTREEAVDALRRGGHPSLSNAGGGGGSR